MQKEFITVTPDTGSGDASLSVVASANENIARSTSFAVAGGGLSRSVTVNQEEGDRFTAWFKRNKLVDDLNYPVYLPNFFDFPPSMSTEGVTIQYIYYWDTTHQTMLIQDSPNPNEYLFDFQTQTYTYQILSDLKYSFTIHDMMDYSTETNSLYVHQNMQPLTVNSDYFSIQGPADYRWYLWINGSLTTFTTPSSNPAVIQWDTAVEKLQSLGWDVSDTTYDDVSGLNTKFVIKKISQSAESIFVAMAEATMSNQACGYATVIR